VKGFSRQKPGIILGVFAYLVFRLLVLKNHDFFSNEAEHLQAAWCLTHGQILYKDFFQNHGPLWYLLIEPIPTFFHDPIHALFAGRILMCFFWIGMLILQKQLGASDVREKTRYLSVLFLASFSSFGRYSIETRPDTVAGLAVSIILVLGQEPLTTTRVAVMGLLTGITLFISPKIVFIVGGYGAGLWFYRREARHPRHAISFLAAVSIPVIAVLGYEWHLGTLSAFFYWFVVFATRMRTLFPWDSPAGPIGSLKLNPVLWGLALMGLWIHRKTPRGWALIAGLAAIPFIPSFPFNWYLILPAPLICIHAAQACDRMMAWASKNAPSLRSWLIGGVALSIAVSFSFQATALRYNTKSTVEGFRYLSTKMSPSDMIMNTGSAYALFRPSPSFYGWLNEDVMESLGAERVETIVLTALRRPECRGIFANPLFFRKYPGAAAFIKAHYHADRYNLWIRN
jgi:hypothetical protein